METRQLIAENWKLKLFKHPTEEAYRVDTEIGAIAVADGVTRDPMKYLPSGFLGKLKFMWYYPKPSPAKKSADIFCETFPLVLKDFDTKDEKAVRKAIEEANNRIGYWNTQNIPNVDYVTNDFAGCVASGTVEQKGIISWGFLTDCGVAIFDEKGNLRFRTESEDPHRLDKYIWQDSQIEGKSWNQPEVRVRIRSHYRNNPNEKHSFGVLTGQKEAMSYVRAGTQEIRPNDYLAVYTDGLEPIIFSGGFADKLKERDIDGLERLCKKGVRTEGTLVLKKFD